MPIKEHEGPRNRGGNMRHDIDDELPAIHNPFSLVHHDGPSPPHAKVTVTKTKPDHEAAGEHAKPVLPIPATTKNKDQHPTKTAGTPAITKPKDQQHHEDHQHATLATAGAIKPTDHQHEDHQHVKLATAAAIKPTDHHQQHEDHQTAIKTLTQAGKPKEKVAAPPAIATHAGKPKEKVAAPPAIATPASSNNTKDHAKPQ